MCFPDFSKMPEKATDKAAKRLTRRPRYCSVVHGTTGYQANHAECGNTPHGSDPTLIMPVSGLRSIIQPRRIPVLRGFGSPTDSFVGVGCLRFLVGEGTC